MSAAIILLCMTVIAGLTFALFTDGDRVKNHLQAGDLEVRLTRTNLKYRYLDEKGVWQVPVIEDDLDFTSSTEDNVFGLDAEGLYIVPGCYFNADMQVDNVGNVAFTYAVSIDMLGEVNELAEQLQVTVTKADGTSETKKLSDMINGETIMAGRMLEDDAPQTFNVDVYFTDDTAINNAAQTQLAEFDLVIIATQIPPPPRE